MLFLIDNFGRIYEYIHVFLKLGRVMLIKARFLSKKCSIFTALYIALTLSLSACQKSDEMPKKSDIKETQHLAIEFLHNDIFTAKAERFQPSVTITGTLQASQKTAVQSTVNAQVRQVLADVGQFVKKGQPLVILDITDSKNQLAQAQADLLASIAQAEVSQKLAQKNKILLEKGFVSQIEYERTLAEATAQAQAVKAKQAQVNSAQKMFGDTTIVAPATGVVGSRNVEIGQVVTPNQPLMEIIDPNHLEFVANIPSEAQSQVRVGQSVAFNIANNDEQFVGQIHRIAPQIDPISRQLPVFITVNAEQHGKLLKAGMFATGTLQFGQMQVGVLVPMSAVTLDKATPPASQVTATNAKIDDNQKLSGMVNVIGQDHIIKTQPVQIVRSLDDSGQYLVTGIEQGMVVITIPIKAEQVGKKAVLK